MSYHDPQVRVSSITSVLEVCFKRTPMNFYRSTYLPFVILHSSFFIYEIMCPSPAERSKAKRSERARQALH